MMATNSESRKRLSEAELHAIERCRERRREAVKSALESIMSGARYDDADAFLLALEDEGGRVVL